MNRLVYWGIVLIAIPFMVMGITLLFGPKEGGGEAQIKFSGEVFGWIILFGFPILSTIRLRYLKYTWKEILRSYFPFSFFNFKVRMREYFGK